MGRCASQAPGSAANLAGNRVDDLAGDFGLDVENVIDGQFAVEGLRPQVFVGGHVDQLGVDADPVAGPLHAAFEDGGDAQFGGDFGDCLGGAAVLHHRGARDHLQVADLGQLREQVVVDAVGEEQVVFVVAAVGEGQHGDGVARVKVSSVRLGRWLRWRAQSTFLVGGAVV